MANSQNGRDKSHETFLLTAYAGLVLRGYDSARQIEDPILREVWKRGRKIAEKEKARG
jgi:hypothetical protein